MLTIKRVKALITAPGGINLVVVKVETSEPGLFGLGCATFAWRALAVKSVVEDYLSPLLAKRDPGNIEDLWQSVHTSAYWRNGPVLNNALSGVDMALWDIKGKLAGLPVYQLWGGQCRDGVPVYLHASGKTPEEVVDAVRERLSRGVNHVRCQLGTYGGEAVAAAGQTAFPGHYFDPAEYARRMPALFALLRDKLGDGPELLHDVHERLAPIDAIRLAKDLEPFRLFFLEDLLPPEQVDWFRTVRAQCATPLAMGELFNHPLEWRNLVGERLIDFIRCHVSQLGGVTPARKLAAQCEPQGIRTAWHGPPDCSPVGHAANLHLDLATSNFGIQEWCSFPDAVREVFPGAPELKRGRARLSNQPGWGVAMDEKKAAKFPHVHLTCNWMHPRLPDGTSAKP